MPEKYVGALEKLPMESSRGRCAAASAPGRNVLLVSGLWPSTQPSISHSRSRSCTLPGQSRRSGKSSLGAKRQSAIAPVEGQVAAAAEGRVAGRVIVMRVVKGATPSCV
jgi:hypothetical protein